jgi:predicted porin/cell division protein FtsB
MAPKMRWIRTCVILTFTACFILLGMAGSAAAVDEKMLERMEQIIKQQQAQIEAQAKALEKLQQQVEALSEKAVQEATEAAKAEVAKASVPPDVLRTKGGDKVSVQLYGQVNRAFLAADDGDSSDYYFVDNDNSSTRLGLLGEAKVNDDLTIGTRMEFEYQSNASNEVNQDDKNPDGGDGDGFDDRWLDVQFTSKRFGKLYLGKGSTASDGTSEVDLSGTDVVGYSSIGDMAGGILFYDDDTNARSATNIGGVFSNFDGLSRRNRIRYDSPEFWGFTLSGSLPSDGGDVALRYAAKWGEDWKFAAAAAYADPQATSDTVASQYNGSASILHSSGINFTVAGGSQDLESGLFKPRRHPPGRRPHLLLCQGGLSGQVVRDRRVAFFGGLSIRGGSGPGRRRGQDGGLPVRAGHPGMGFGILSWLSLA